MRDGERQRLLMTISIGERLRSAGRTAMACDRSPPPKAVGPGQTEDLGTGLPQVVDGAEVLEPAFAVLYDHPQHAAGVQGGTIGITDGDVNALYQKV